MKKIGELLIEAGKVSERDIERALLAQREMGDRLGQVLIKLGLVSELDMIRALSEQLDIPVLLASDFPDEPVELPEIPQIFLLSNAVVPVSRSDKEIVFAASAPQDPYLCKALAMALETPVRVVFALEGDISRALDARDESREDDEEDEFSDQFSGQSDDE